MLKKGLVATSWKKKKYFFRYLSERQNLALYEPSKVIFSTLPGKLHIVAEMLQREDFWMLFRIMSEEQKLCSPI